MRVLIALEQRFRRDVKGRVFGNGVSNYAFFERYLAVFDEVVVFARVKYGEGADLASYQANGPRVRFFEVPYFVGPIQLMKKRRDVRKAAVDAIKQADAFILRVPGMMGTLIWRELRKQNSPYGVEVVGDPWESVNTCGGRSVLRPMIRLGAYWTMKQQCVGAAVAAYVTEQALQKRYPPGHWSTSYSSVELKGDGLIDSMQLANRLGSAKAPFEKRRPFRICHIGSMDALYKAQDILIEAVGKCRRKGFAIELSLLGDGRYRSVFERKAKLLGISECVYFRGNLSPPEVREALDESDVFVLPSLTEGLPRVLIEAMARGLPCLASRIGGIPELLDEQALFPVRNSAVLADKLAWFLSDYDRCCLAARANRSRASDYRADVLEKRRQACYQQLEFITGKGVMSF